MPITPAANEQLLIAHAQAGDADAYGALVSHYQSQIVRLNYRMLGDHAEALDLAQEAFIRGYRALASFELGRPFGPWIAQIATRLVLNWLQRRCIKTVALEEEQESSVSFSQHVSDEYANPELLMLASERQERLRQAILALPTQYRAVLILRHENDLSYAEIAATLGLPLSDVKSHLFRARNLLRTELEDI